jgi:hypothetical protein
MRLIAMQGMFLEDCNLQARINLKVRGPVAAESRVRWRSRRNMNANCSGGSKYVDSNVER